MIRRLCCAFALGIVVLATSVPSASAATVSPSDWAPKFCTAVTDYQTTISQESESMSTAMEQVTDLATARDQIASFLGKMVDAAKTAQQEIKAAGVPSSPNGAKIQSLFIAGLGASGKVFAKGESDAEKLPTTSVQAFKVKGKQLGSDLTSAADKLGKSFSGIGKLDKGKKLEAAVKAAPECAAIA